jgi:hypothetical protein
VSNRWRALIRRMDGGRFEAAGSGRWTIDEVGNGGRGSSTSGSGLVVDREYVVCMIDELFFLIKHWIDRGVD